MLALLFAPFVVGVPSMPRMTGSIATPRTGTAFLVDGSRDWLRAYDWTTTSLGGPETWSSSLRLLADLVLQSDYPMALLWGSEHILLYNDAFSAIVGPDDHPRAFGRAVQETLPDLWESIAPSLDPGGLLDPPRHRGESDTSSSIRQNPARDRTSTSRRARFVTTMGRSAACCWPAQM